MIIVITYSSTEFPKVHFRCGPKLLCVRSNYAGVALQGGMGGCRAPSALSANNSYQRK